MIDVPSSADVHSAVAVDGGGGTPQQVRQLRHAHGAGVRLNAWKLWLLIKPLVQKDHLCTHWFPDGRVPFITYAVVRKQIWNTLYSSYDMSIIVSVISIWFKDNTFSKTKATKNTRRLKCL